MVVSRNPYFFAFNALKKMPGIPSDPTVSQTPTISTVTFVQAIRSCQLVLQCLLFVRIRLPVRGKYVSNSPIIQIDRRDTKTGDHAADTARSKRAPAESKKEDFVARIIDVRQERITILHLLEKPLSHGSARQMVNRGAIGADAAVVILEL